jgi:hypothetical protein
MHTGRPAGYGRPGAPLAYEDPADSAYVCGSRLVSSSWVHAEVVGGLPPIKLHEARHTASSLADEADASQEIRQKTLATRQRR